MRSISGFSFFSKVTYSRKKPSLSIPKKSIESLGIVRKIECCAEIIEKWNTEYVSETKFYSLFRESKREAKEFVKRVKELQNAMDLLIREDPNSEYLVRAHKLMQIAMKRLQNEFLQILSMNRAHLDPESVSPTSVVSNNDNVWHDSRMAENSIVEVEEASKNSSKDLKSIAECMIAAGYAKECVSTYKSIRKWIVNEAIYRLGVEKISSSKAKKMPGEIVEWKMMTWVEAVKVSINTLFSGEKTLSDEVFECSASLRESCFSDISKEGALLLFEFPEAFATRDKKNPIPKKIFPLLNMYCAIIDNLPMIESIFSFQSTSSVGSQALNSLNRLRESILLHLVDFESEIRKESSTAVVPGGRVHPMTISAMDYLSRLAEYSNALMDILIGTSSSAKALMPQTYFNAFETEGSPTSELRIRFAWLILVLLCKIDSKAEEMYKEFSMQYLFLANNLQHVTSRVRSSNLKQLLGDDWIARHFEKVRQFARSYERLAWGPVASMCPAITTNEAVEMSLEEVKMQFEMFNESFENTYNSHSMCVVSDPKLLDEMRLSIWRMLLPIYRDFYDAVILAGKEVGSIVRYTPEDIGKHLLELFSRKVISENPFVCLASSNLVTAPPTPCKKSRSLSCTRF